MVWLFSPVVGRHFPGDLWGIDSKGRLLLVETKIAGGFPDPFIDFIDFERNRAKEVASQLDPRRLEKRWRNLLQAEKRFIASEAETWKTGRRERKMLKGVVPYSSKRDVVWCWRGLYFSDIAPLFQQESDYEVTVAEYLRVYAEYRPPPHYIGLFTAFEGMRAQLSIQGREHMVRLKELAGEERVHIRIVEATREEREAVSFKGHDVMI